jgi:hypothetical protein
MQNSTHNTATTPADTTEFADGTELDGAAPEQDPAGGITLSGRGRAGTRMRVLAGMMVTAGLVAAGSGTDTVSSFNYVPFIHVL